MFDLTESYFEEIDDSIYNQPITKPNIRTGEGRRVKLRIGSTKEGDQKKKQHRKMAKKSRRANRK